MNRRYEIVDRADRRGQLDPARMAALLAKEGQILLPFLDLIEHAETAVDDLIDVMGRATIEAVLIMSAAAVAGPKQQGKKADRDIANHGSQTGRVALKERRLRVTKPRLRKKSPQPGEAGEVEITAHEAMRKDGRLADRMRRVKHWQSGEMALRWTAASFEAASKAFRRLMGYKDLWMLKAALDDRNRDQPLARQAAG